MCYNVYTAGSNSTKGAEIMDDKKIAYKDTHYFSDIKSQNLVWGFVIVFSCIWEVCKCVFNRCYKFFVRE